MRTLASRCARTLKRNLPQLTDLLLRGAGADRAPNRFDEPPESQSRRIGDSLNLLVRYLEGNEAFGYLYGGQRMFELYHPNRTAEENSAYIRENLSRDRRYLRCFLASRLSGDELSVFEHAFDSITAGLLNDTGKRIRTLLIGDCMMAEIASFLIAATARDGLSITPFPINSLDPAMLSQLISKLAYLEYDVVFFSPFSHGRIPEYEQFLDPRRNFMPRARIDAILGNVISETERILDFLMDTFECPIFIHNSAALHRGLNIPRIVIKEASTFRARAIAMNTVNEWLRNYVDQKSAATYNHAWILDEAQLAASHGRLKMGHFLHDSEFQHPIRMSEALSIEYRHRIYAIGHLVGKKLVICDLDDTLWDGIIGEGPVAPLNERQEILKKLKDDCGVLLSIASKNDADKIHFDNCVLNIDDFVAPQINWGAKANSIRRIQKLLNLQLKHFVFIDDRPEECELVKSACPGIHVMDATEDATWKALACWAEISAGSSELDRTELYRERDKREGFVETERLSSDQQQEILRRLELRIEIRQAAKSDLKRVAELINRSNQWNLCGSRVTYKQARVWQASTDVRVFVSEVSDRFGKMGTVCVAVVELKGDRAQIPILVLSCRAFGFGVESAMLSYISRKCVVEDDRKELIGWYKATAQNHLARDMYANHGFVGEGEEWHWRGAPAIEPPPWATVVFS